MIEPMLQDRFDRAVGDCADVIAASAGRLDACRAVTAGEPQDAETDRRGSPARDGAWPS